jgi:sulfur-carrier protein
MQAIQLRYFALLREERGLAAEVIETTARTPRDLYQELAGQHGFSLPADRVGVAINESFAAMDRELAANDVVVFIPPVAGG